MLPPKVTRNNCQLASERWTSPREEIPWPLVALVRKTLTVTPILGLLPRALHCTHTAGKAWHLSPVHRGKRSPWGSLPPSGVWPQESWKFHGVICLFWTLHLSYGTSPQLHAWPQVSIMSSNSVTRGHSLSATHVKKSWPNRSPSQRGASQDLAPRV